jgi:predicted CXXCH cytochrome family protein
MHLSRCYQSSATFTCLTCHNPHAEVRPEARAAHFRSICLGCHEAERCTMDRRQRHKESPDDNCVQCHMPSSPTDIPHLAFTHHRVGIHTGPKADDRPRLQPGGTPTLQPVHDLSRFSAIDRQRSLGLAYLETADQEKGLEAHQQYAQQALQLLTEVRTAGLKDAVVDVALARLKIDLGQTDEALNDLVASAAADPTLVSAERCNALYFFVTRQGMLGRYDEARDALRELTSLRRNWLDWQLLADCERRLGNDRAELEALAMAVRIHPRMWQGHQQLAERYRVLGDAARAAWHTKRAVP